MNDAFGVRRRDVGDINRNVEEPIEFHAWPLMKCLCLAIEKFHGDEGFVVLFADVVNGANVG
jgi:hypothetical protein